MNKSLSILFAGEAAPVVFLDGAKRTVFVRALPQRFLGLVLQCCEFKQSLVELCAYYSAPIATDDKPAEVDPLFEGEAAFPEVPPPVRMLHVPAGWCDNLSDESIEQLYEKAKELNFQRAADWGKGQIAAKKMVAPLHEAAISQVMPIVERMMAPLVKKFSASTNSTPNAQPSSAARGSSS